MKLNDINMINNSGKQIIKGGSKKTTIKIGSIVLIGILAILLLGINKTFNSPEKRIVGTWENDDGYVYIFQKSGQFSAKTQWAEQGTYVIEGDLLTIIPLFDEPESFRFSVSSTSLKILDEDDGKIIDTLKKKK